jgi:hypothetical protein
MRLMWTMLALTGLMVTPYSAMAAVEVFVPKRFMGDPGAAPAPSLLRSGALPLPRAADDDCEGFTADECVILTDDQRRLDAPDPEPDAGPAPGSPEAEPDTVVDPATEEPVRQSNDRGHRTEAGHLTFPASGDWLTVAAPVLRWRGTGARHYNVQIFANGRRVMTGWSTRPRLRLPLGRLRQGQWYSWTVFPGRGARTSARFGPSLGQSVFRAPIRVRMTFRASGPGRPLMASVSPRLPGAIVRLAPRKSTPARIPRLVRTGDDSTFRLATSRSTAEGLRAWLIDRGPRPPAGLRG